MPNMMLIAVVVVILAVLGFIVTRGKGTANPESSSSADLSADTSPSLPESAPAAADTTPAQTINVEGGMFYFKPDKISVKVGQPGEDFSR